MTLLESLKPGVPRPVLFFGAACAWLTAGTILVVRGEQALAGNAPLTLCGIAGGVLFFLLLFRHIAGRHIVRIRGIVHARPCFFSFLDWRGYALMALMISGGIFLRSSGILPPLLLGTFYVGMGTPLVISSFRFARAGITDREAA